MRELWNRFSLPAKIGAVGALLGFAAGMFAVFIVDVVAGLIITTLCVALLAFCLWFFFGSTVQRFNIIKRGEPAEATILEVHETGITINNNYPMAKLVLEVHPPDGEPFVTKAKCLMNRFDIPAYQPGMVVPVSIDPRNRKRVAVNL